MATKEQLDTALTAWEVARDRSMAEQNAWGTLNQNHSALITSLRKHGHTWAQAQAEFEKLSQAHRESLIAAWRAMDERCREYQELRKNYEAP